MKLVAYLLWWPRTSSYYLKCLRCVRDNESRWAGSDGVLYPVFDRDLDVYGASCNCGVCMKPGDMDLFERSFEGLMGLPRPETFL